MHPMIVGIDVGSVAVSLAVVGEGRKVVEHVYAFHRGDAAGTVSRLLASLNLSGGVRVAVTGAGRKLAGRVVGADLVLDEITAHARAARELRPDVDTVIEIGGQDSKFTTLQDGRVNFCVMNTVCAAGTGSFIDEQARKLGCPLAEYAGRALNSPAPMASDRCTVFMERDINHLIFEGYSPNEILAAVLHSIAESYLSKVAAAKRMGRVI